jgi:hypothetical protein
MKLGCTLSSSVRGRIGISLPALCRGRVWISRFARSLQFTFGCIGVGGGIVCISIVDGPKGLITRKICSSGSPDLLPYDVR